MRAHGDFRSKVSRCDSAVTFGAFSGPQEMIARNSRPRLNRTLTMEVMAC